MALAPLLLVAGACQQSPKARKQAAVYGPTETLLEVVSVLRRHVPDDTYRFPAATDFTGRNVYRSALLRLENLEVLHAELMRAGHMDGVVAFSKARALERLRAYSLAASHYRRAAEREPELAEEALRSARFCEDLDAAVEIGLERIDPMGGQAEAPAGALPVDAEPVLGDLDGRQAALSLLLQRSRREGPGHYEAVVRQEIERADVLRAHYFEALRHVLPDGSVRAVAERQRVVARHGPSKDRHRHVIALADLYARLAREYAAAHPPESLHFDPPTFQELVDAAAHLYQSVADRDGTPEKLEAARRFEAFLAFTLKVDRDRFAR